MALEKAMALVLEAVLATGVALVLAAVADSPSAAEAMEVEAQVVEETVGAAADLAEGRPQAMVVSAVVNLAET